jgi:hypothetical protein
VDRSGSSSPSEPEEADRDAKRGDRRGTETLFRLDDLLAHFPKVLVEPEMTAKRSE